MNTLDAIYSRRSIRNFNGEKLSETELREIIRAAWVNFIRAVKVKW